jgi:hypothetical protein
MSDHSKSREYGGCYKCIANSAYSCEYCKNKTKIKIYNNNKSKLQDKLDQVNRGIYKLYFITMDY